ncbi:unnamed protein product [Phytophthora fragariaefolia]|uniref:Unnamed protein product n=1 Tax=Phytophthora fragariaefolia TaxID=1490495 RepID=A0A9W7CY41_9STRA|nr:unnamed protein product [Phytophthora fragariaefolia]
MQACPSPRVAKAFMHPHSAPSRSLHHQVTGVVGILLLLLLLESWWHSGPRHFEEVENEHELDFYPLDLLQDAQEIQDSERLHLAVLHEGCMKHRESVITSDFGRNGDKDSSVGRFQRDDKNLRQKLEKCPDVEVFLPSGIRGDGYCEDAMGYVKYLHGRALPRWVLDLEFDDEKTGKTLTYHDLCPTTPLIFMNHFWDGVPDSPSWPASKLVYLMPNVEIVFKGTNAVLDCWLSRPDFPPLDVFMDQDIYNKFLRTTYHESIREQPKVTVHTGRVPDSMFGRMMVESAFLLCTSVLEGYGHYINQARASAAVIVTTDAPPMNELLPAESAVLVPHPRATVDKQLLGGAFDGEHGLEGVKGMATYVKGGEVCAAVDRILEMTPEERQAMGERARKQYVLDTRFFAAKMAELRALARSGHARCRQQSAQSPGPPDTSPLPSTAMQNGADASFKAEAFAPLSPLGVGANEDLLAALDEMLAFTPEVAAPLPLDAISDAFELPEVPNPYEAPLQVHEPQAAAKQQQQEQQKGKDARMTPYPKPKPRRRKRPKDELDYLRAKVADLEEELTKLNQGPGGRMSPASDDDDEMFSRWKQVAERQKEEANRTVVENLKLRAMLKGQLEIAKRLETAIADHQQEAAAQALPLNAVKKEFDVEEEDGTRRPHAPSIADEVIFAELNGSLEAQYAQVDSLFEASGIADVNREMLGQINLQQDLSGISFGLKEVRLMPFTIHAVARVMWSLLLYESSQMPGRVETRVINNDHLNATIVDTLQLPKSRRTKVFTRFAVRRYYEANRVVVV